MESSTSTGRALEASCASTVPLESGKPASQDDGATCRELAKLTDVSLIASRVQSSVLDLVLSSAEPELAGGVALFGLGFLVVPFLADLAGSRQVHDLLSADELEKRFGPLDVEFMVREICMSHGELDIHTKMKRTEDLEREIKGMKKWRQHLTACLRLLQKRAALAFLGLTSEASENDINKVYKKMALEYHPDKGGDPVKFQELQEMRKRIIETDNDKKPEDEPPDAEDEVMVEEKDVCRDRLSIHGSVMRLWDSIKKTKAEICSSAGQDAQPQEALTMLRLFIDGFVGSDMRIDGHDDIDKVQIKFDKFISMGAEIITGTALLEPGMTHVVLAMHVDCSIRPCCTSPQFHQQCSKLLEAVLSVRKRSADVMEQLEALQTGSQDTLKVCRGLLGIPVKQAVATEPCMESAQAVENKQHVDRELPAQSDQPELASGLAESCTSAVANISKDVEDRVPLVSWLREKMRLHQAKTNNKLASMTGQEVCQAAGCALLKQPDDTDLMTFETPPVECGDCEMKLKMLDRGILEEVDASLFDRRKVQVGSLRGMYVFRQENFLHICQQASHAAASCSSSFFTSAGCPKSPFRDLLAPKACKGGFLFIDAVSVAPHLRGTEVASDFVRTVLQCLAGPMKRLTLAMCALEAASEAVAQEAEPSSAASSALQHCWLAAGFSCIAEGEHFFFSEVGAAGRRPNRRHLDTGRSSCADMSSAATMEPPAKRPRNIATPQASCPEPQREHPRAAVPAAPAVPAVSTAPQASADFVEGARVKYLSHTAQKWVTAKIVRCNPDGTFDLDVKRRAKRDLIRVETAGGKASSNSSKDQVMTYAKDDELLMVKQEIERYEQKIKELVTGRSDHPADVCDLRSPVKRVGASAPDELLAVKEEIEFYEQKIKAITSDMAKSVELTTPSVQELSRRDAVMLDASHSSCKLTPRMQHVLIHAGKTALNALRLDADRFTSGKLGGHYWGCKFFPAHLQQVYKAFLKGMADVVNVVIRLLEQQRIPTVSLVMQILSPSSGVPGDVVGLCLNKHFVSHFFGMGGKVDHVIRAVAREASLLYNAHESGDADDLQWGDALRSYHDLPIHMLDGDFDFVESLLM